METEKAEEVKTHEVEIKFNKKDDGIAIAVIRNGYYYWYWLDEELRGVLNFQISIGIWKLYKESENCTRYIINK